MVLKKIHKFLSSARLAMALLVTILVCCLVGVVILRDQQRAAALIFGTIWFNLILVVLVINIACCFFGRIWGRKVTVISFGMILFHLSFVAMLGGIIYNSLFYFKGTIRVTEGEVLPSGNPDSYDTLEHGLFFNFAQYRGETSLVKMHTGYKADKTDKLDKRAAYEISVGEGGSKKQGVIYVTKSMDHKGFNYFNEKEGYSVLVQLEDKKGGSVYAAFVPLQSYQQNKDMKNREYLYTTGTKEGPGSFPYPQEPLKPLFSLQVSFAPSKLKEGGGDVTLQVWPLGADETEQNLVATAKVPVGDRVAAGDYFLSAKEVRYWVGMTVRRDPGKPVVLTSLWAALCGMIITFIGRIRKSGQ